MAFKLITGISITIIAFAVILVFSIQDNNVEKVNSEPIKLSINPFPGTDFAFIAKEKGFFKQNNVDVELVFSPNYSDTVEEFSKGRVDGAFEVYADALLQNADGIENKIVYVMDYSTNGDVLIGNVSSIKDLEGKTLGTNGIQSFSHYFVVNLLEKHGLSKDTVFFKNVDETKVLDALNNNEIVAGHTWEPTKSKALSQGYTVLGTAGEIPGVILDVLVLSDEITSDRPEDVKAIISSLEQAKEFLISNPDESIEIMRKYESLSFEDMKMALDDAYRPNLSENKKMLTDMNEGSLQYFGNSILTFYSEKGAINKIPDLDKILDSRFLGL